MKTIGKTLILVCLCLAVAGLLAACGAAATPTAAAPTQAPTADLNALRTEVAATVLAQVPELCALTPTATLEPTATEQPSPTVDATQATPVASFTPGTPAAGTTPSSNQFDRAQWVSQTVADGTNFQPGQEFIMTWKVQNTGTTTWNNKYILRFFAGNQLSAPTELQLTQDVPPGQTVDLTLTMRAPKTAGEYVSQWVLSNQDRSNYKEGLYLKIIVPAPTKTPTVTPKPSATLTPSITPTK